MTEMPRLKFSGTLLLVVVVAVAGGVRAWYISTCADNGRTAGPLQVQGHAPIPAYPPDTKFRNRDKPDELDALIDNLAEHQWFGCLAPLADQEEKTAHRAPGYPWLLAYASRWHGDIDQLTRWAQAVLGALAAACYFLFARRAFRSNLVALLAGLLCALNPYWIINTAEINDGTLTTFLLAAAIALGTRGSQEGGAFTSLLFGLTLAGLSMVRAALLPFSAVAVLWYVLRCGKLSKGWFAALLAFLGFANGLGPWTVRNFQAFGKVVPIADSAPWHLWMGNNPQATGGPMDEKDLRKVLGPERVQELSGEENQARRYFRLLNDVWAEISADPGSTVTRRLWACLYFVFGEAWFKESSLSLRSEGSLPAWLDEIYPGLLSGTLLGMLLLGLLGWRWTHVWRSNSRLATLALMWVPLPYLLSHAGHLAGPRLPLDGILITYSAFVLGSFIPRTGRFLRRGPEKERWRKDDLK